MKQTKQKILLCCMPIVAVMCAITFMLSGCFTHYIPTIEDVAQELADDWGIHLPEDAELLYYLHCSYWTDSETYCVIGFEKPPVLLDFSFGRDDSIIGEVNYHIAHMSKDKQTEIPTEYLPDGEAEYCWKKIQDSRFIYDDFHHTYYPVTLLYYPEYLELYVLILHW